jgi:hypothetical protein
VERNINDAKRHKVPGAILHLKTAGTGVTRELIEELFENYAAERFIDFRIGQSEAYVRFAGAYKAQFALDMALKKNPGAGVQINGKPRTHRLSGDKPRLMF